MKMVVIAMEYRDLFRQIEKSTAFEIEEAICEHCNAGYADNSEIPIIIPLDKTFRAEIWTPANKISCCICVSKNQNGNFDLSVTSIKVKSRRSRL